MTTSLQVNRLVAYSQARRASRLVLWLILGLGIFHLVYAGSIGLTGDEAYYWQWARQLDLGYYDHPPMVAYVIALGTWLGGPGEFGVRLTMVLFMTGMLVLVYRIAVRYARITQTAGTTAVAPEAAGLWAVAALAATPLFSLGGVLATPDAPMVFFWVLAVALTLDAQRRPRWHVWLLLGAILGLGVLSKYSFGVLPLALLIAFAATRRGRALLRTPGPYLAAAAAVVVLTPHLVWLARHDFVSLLFQLGHGLDGAGRYHSAGQRFDSFLQFVAGQIGVVTPFLFALFMIALNRCAAAMSRRSVGVASDAEAELMTWVLGLPAVLTLLLFALASLAAKSQANWPTAAYPTLAVLLGVFLARRTAGTRLRKGLAIGAIGLAGLVSAYVHLESARPMVPYESSMFDKLPEKKGLASWLESQRAASGEKSSAAVLADNYRIASLLAFYLPDHPRTDAIFEAGSGSQYNFWRSAPPQGQAWYLTRSEHDSRLSTLFSDYRYAGTYVDRRAGVVTGHVYAWYGHLRARAELDRLLALSEPRH